MTLVSERQKQTLLMLTFFLAPLLAVFFDQMYQMTMIVGKEGPEVLCELREKIYELNSSTSEIFQLKKALNAFYDECFENLSPSLNCSAIKILDSYHGSLNTILPKHDVLIAREFPGVAGVLAGLFWRYLSLEDFFQFSPCFWKVGSIWEAIIESPKVVLGPNLLPCFVSGDFRGLTSADAAQLLKLLDGKKQSDNRRYPSEYRDQFSDSLSDFIGYPFSGYSFALLLEKLQEKPDGFFCGFQTKSDKVGLFCCNPVAHQDDRFEGNLPRVLVFFLLKLDEFPTDFGNKQIVRKVDEGSEPIGIAFKPDDKLSPIVFSRFFDNLEACKDFITEKSEIMSGNWWSEKLGNTVLCSAPVLAGDPGRIILAKTLTGKPLELWSHQKVVLIVLGVMIVGAVFILRRGLLGVGPRWGIGTLLLLAFLTVSLIPVIFAKTLFRISLDEYLEKQRADNEQKLWDIFERLDANFILLHSNLLYQLNHLGNNRDYLSLVDPGRKKSFKEAKAALGRANPRYPIYGEPRVFLNIILKDDGEEFGYALHDDNDNTKRTRNMISGVFRSLLISLLSRVNIEFRNLQNSGKFEGSKEKKAVDFNEVKGDLQGEFVQDFFRGILGRKTFFQLVSDFRYSLKTATLMLDLNILISAQLFEPFPRLLSVFLWSNNEMGEDFRKAYIGGKHKLPENCELLAVRKADHQGYLDATSRNIPPAIWNLVERVRNTGVPQISRMIDKKHKKLLAATSLKHLNTQIFGAALDQSELESKRQESESLFQYLVIGVSSLAVLFGFLVNRHFVAPLRRLGEGIKAIARQDFAFRLDENRPDEFGVLAKAFNIMAKGLLEGTLLGKYVSSELLEIIRDKKAYSKALAGERREVTVVFSSLKNFDKFRENAKVKEVFDLLSRNIGACNRGVKKHGGIIDKVIGDKIMLFFDHRALGGGKKAVNSALGVIKEIRAEFSCETIKPIIGVNSGFAIAGILGASEVHLDYTVIGDAVNLAARLNDLAKKCDESRVVISGETRKIVDSDISLEKLAETRVKGKIQEIEAYLIEEISLDEFIVN